MEASLPPSPTEALPQAPRALKGLEVLPPDTLAAKADVGKRLFATSALGGVLGDVGRQLGDRQRDLATQAAASRPDLVGKVRAASDERKTAIADERAKEGEVIAIGKKLRTHEELQTQAKVLEAGGDAVVIDDERVVAQGTARAYQEAVGRSAQKLTEQRETKLREAAEARKKREAVSLTRTVMSELEKVLPNMQTNRELAAVNDVAALLETATQELPQYQAALVMAAEGVIQQAGEGKPLKDTVFRAAQTMDTVQKAADQAEVNLAMQLDFTPEARSIAGRKVGRFTAEVAGMQERRTMAMREAAQRRIEEIKSRLEDQGYPPEAVKAAADQVRVLVEKPGFGKKALGDELLTEQGLHGYETKHTDELVDPIRKKVFSKVGRTSVEGALGCQVTVSRDAEGAERKLDFGLSEKRQEGEPPGIFEKVAGCEAVDLQLRRELQNTNPEEVVRVQELVTALQENDGLRQSLLKMADARVNGLFIADGVRSGALKTKLAEAAVKGGEAALVGGVTVGAAAWLFNGRVEAAKDIMHAAAANVDSIMAQISTVTAEAAQVPGKITEIWSQLSAADLNTLSQSLAGLNLGDLIKGVQSQDLVTAKTGADVAVGQAADLANNLNAVAARITEIGVLQQTMATAKDTAAALQASVGPLQAEAAQNVLKTGEAAKWLVSITGGVGTVVSAMSLVDAGRRMIGRPVRSVTRTGERLVNSVRRII